MQTAIHRGCQGLKPLGDRRSIARTPAFGSATCRRSSVKVLAKGKNKLSSRPGLQPSQAEMMRREVPTPEVDPKNAEFVLFFRCLKYKDPVIKEWIGPSPWVPLTVVKGDQALNFVAKAVESKWGKQLYGHLLITQLAGGIFKEKERIEKDLKKRMPPFATAGPNDFQYAFKIRDKANPKDWNKAENITIVPPQEEFGKTGLDLLKAFFSFGNLAAMFKSPEKQ